MIPWLMVLLPRRQPLPLTLSMDGQSAMFTEVLVGIGGRNEDMPAGDDGFGVHGSGSEAEGHPAREPHLDGGGAGADGEDGGGDSARRRLERAWSASETEERSRDGRLSRRPRSRRAGGRRRANRQLQLLPCLRRVSRLHVAAPRDGPR